MKNSKHQPGLHQKLQEIIDHNIRYRMDGKVSSHATRNKVAATLHLCIRELKELGYRLDDPEKLKGKHIKALGEYYERLAREGKMPASTIQGRFSALRAFCSWVGKDGMVERTENYVDPEFSRRTTLCILDKSGQAQGIDVAAKLEEICAKDRRVGLQLKLEFAFGLRGKEAMMLRPYLADKGVYLDVSVGTKGGRPRVVSINTREQRALLEQAKAMAPSKTASISDPAKSLKQWKNHYYYVLKACKVGKEFGLTAHGLRHAYAHNRYKELSGQESPVRGGKVADRETDRAARLQLAEELGHSRECVTTYYLGRDKGGERLSS